MLRVYALSGPERSGDTMYIQIVALVARAIKGLFERAIGFLAQDVKSKHAVIAHYSGYRWCDSTERALNEALMGRGTVFKVVSDECPLLAQSGHRGSADECPLSGGKADIKM